MANNIILKKSSVAAKIPLTSDLAYGELALNYQDGKLYYKNASGTSISSITDASIVGPASSTDNAIARFDSTTGKLIQNSLVTVGDTGAITAPQVGSVIPFYYDDQTTFPSASSYHGALAHSHANGAMYFAHGGVWLRMLDTGGPLGTPASGTATYITGLPLSTGVTGTLPVVNGGTGTTTPSLVAGTNVTVTGTWPNQTVNATASGSGTVTSIIAGTGLTGGTITTTGTIALVATAVTAGTYTNTNITVDAYGRITAASTGSGGGGTSGTVTSIVAGTGLTGGTITATGTIALATTTVAAGTYTNTNITVDAYGRITAASTGSGGSGGGASASNNSLTRNYTGTGSQTAFTVTSGCTVDSVLVIQNGVVQTPTSDYTISSTTLSFVTAPALNDTVQIRELATGISSSGATSKSIAMALIFGS